MAELTPILTDAATLRARIADRVAGALAASFPLDVRGRTLGLKDVRVADREFSPVEQYRALLTDGSLQVPVKGTLVLTGADGRVLDEAKDFTLVHLPYFTERHTLVLDGNEYQVANMLRRKPGVYVARGENGALRATFNLARGKNFDLGLDPAKGTLHVALGATHVPLYPVLRALGVPHADVAAHWGAGVAAANRAAHDHQQEAAVGKLYAKLEHASAFDARAPVLAKLQAVKARLDATVLDPETTTATLGAPHAKVTGAALLAASRKLLRVHEGAAEVDDADSLAFKTFHAIDDLLAERVRLSARAWAPKARFALAGKAKIREALRPAPFTAGVRKFVTTSQLAAVPTGINPLELIDHAVKITALGEGGIPSERAIPLEARMTHATHFGVIDPVRTPESTHAGVDVRAAMLAFRDGKGNLYTPLRDARTGKQVFVRAGEQHRHVVAFPGQALTGQVDAFVDGRVQKVDAKRVDYQALNLAQLYSPATALIPMIHNIQGNRAIMGSKMGTQALPLIAREAPLVQVKSHLGEHSFERVLGHMVVPRAPVAGTVRKIEDGWIYIEPHRAKAAEDHEALTKAAGAALVRVPFQQHFPFPSKTFLHHELSVRPGQKVEEDQALGDSNFTRDGVLALGKNLRVAYMAYHGLNSNDAVVISEGCARALTSEHMYREVYPLTPQTVLSREKHRIYFGTKYTHAQYAALNERGVVKKGATIHPKDLLVAGLGPNPLQGTDALLGRISKVLAKPHREVALRWEHGTAGEVIDVVETPTQVAILVKTQERMQVGDKLCYDAATDVLTADGWKPVHAVKLTDRVATLVGEELRYEAPSATHAYAQGERMYRLHSQQVDLLVTENHYLYVQPRGASTHGLYRARDVAGKRVRHRKDAAWTHGHDTDVVLPPLQVKAGQAGRGTRFLPEVRLNPATYAMLLGAFVSEGNLVDHSDSGAYGIDIAQTKEPNRGHLLATLTALHIPFSEHGHQTKVRIYSKQLLEHFRPLGKAHEKYLPPFVFAWRRETLATLFDWLMWGDGHTRAGRPISYVTTSERLAADVQRLALHVGYAANIRSRHVPLQRIKGKTYACRERYDVRIVTTKLRPEVNHGHARTQRGQREAWVDAYAAPVYGVTVPSGIIYVRRNGKAVWSGNSGRYGNKGVVARIVPDHEMIRDAHDQPVDLIMTSAGVNSRINPAQIIETAVAKVAEKTGRPIVYDNAAPRDAVAWAKDLLARHGVRDKEVVYDPVHQRHIVGADGRGVLVGRQYIYKLFKSTDTNFAGHGVGPYDLNEQPLKTGGDESAKGLGKMEFDALLAHNARNILHEAATIRGQKNDEFWRAIQLGQALPTPKPSFAFAKFTAFLEGAGVKVDKRGSKFKLLPLTDRDVAARSAGPIVHGKTVVAKNLKPEPGGLFDPVHTGGPQGTLYSHIDLHEPVVNPVFEEPVRRLLGWSQAEFAGHVRERGGAWVRSQLARLDPPQRLAALRAQLKTASGQALNDVVKQIKYLEALRAEKLAPQEAYVITKVPVIPPVFRPILPQPNDPSQLMVADANRLYGHLLDANHVLKATVLPSDLPSHRAKLYHAVGAVYGTHEPDDDALRGQAVKGFLTQIGGQGSPKGGFFQRKLMRRTQDVSGRGTAVPDGNLGMDEVGLPEDQLWKMLDKLLVARLVRTGYPALHARELVDKRAPAAHDALMAEIRERPVLINRAPTLHRFSLVAAYARPVPGKTIRVNSMLEKGMNLDYDGDTLQVHVPVTPGGVEDAKQMTLSNLLLSDQTRNKLLAFPQHEAIIGVALASKAGREGTGPVRRFPTRDAALAAWRRGELRLTDAIEVDAPPKHAAEDGDAAAPPDPSPAEVAAALSSCPAEHVTGERDEPTD